ncbi:prepilin-type N-terminal cleavage/methylation domain-containing protein [Cellulomonas sp. DKR-3]|uniref:Prepilin-type N-terminal cleavage/methylation domain-containing protein n=1 Tax=Cellulomonas fulva TaxID=2835530 RepID=A0ABS5U1D3_9CELL|nr:prepilin-type N-terminal cleavage/methylation domain-containing protein [Cellulomonas fulva]MBT0995206.1 prepilin-type N-terminal cleavage/methylation domain-containing protein [Cellulomonas fulva]
MIARIRKSMEEKDQGFTLIELLVVMIIIGILAAIAIPVFLNQRKKAEDSAAKADVSTIGKEVATYYVDNADDATLTVEDSTGRYVLSGAGVASGSGDLGKVSNNVELDGSTDLGTSDDWCVAVVNDKGDKAVDGFKYSAKGGLEEGTC